MLCVKINFALDNVALDEMGNRIDELEQSINDLRSEMGQDGSPSPSVALKSKEDPKVKQIQGDWHFNASLFLPFKMLRVLSLSQNSLIGWVENQGFEKLSELSELKVLNLFGNNFNRSVLLSLSHLTSLKSLNLDLNSLDGSGNRNMISIFSYAFVHNNIIFCLF
nr:polygalacturonase inhibitor-like [Ipomoea trifida]